MDARAEKAKKKLKAKEAPRQVQKAVEREIKKGSVVSINKANHISARPSKNINRVKAATSFKAKRGIKTTRRPK